MLCVRSHASHGSDFPRIIFNFETVCFQNSESGIPVCPLPLVWTMDGCTSKGNMENT